MVKIILQGSGRGLKDEISSKCHGQVSIIRGMVRVYTLFFTQGACCTHTYHHLLVGVATIAASYPFLTPIIFWKGVQ
jgi:hypothetical protein